MGTHLMSLLFLINAETLIAKQVYVYLLLSFIREKLKMFGLLQRHLISHWEKLCCENMYVSRSYGICMQACQSGNANKTDNLQ